VAMERRGEGTRRNEVKWGRREVEEKKYGWEWGRGRGRIKR